MRFSSSSTLLALSSYALLANALPYWSQQAVERSLAESLTKRKVPYQVVPVDGGPSSSVPPETKTEETTKTITRPASTLPPTTQTIISTIIITESDVETTVVVTSTQCPSCPSDTPDPPSAPSVEVAATEYWEATVTNAVYTAAADMTMTTSQPTSTSTCDDGMYHTTWSTWNSTMYAPTAATAYSSSLLPSLPPTTDAPASPTEVPTDTYQIDESRPPAVLLRRLKKHRKPSPTSDLPPPHLPKLPKTISDEANPTEIPTIDLSKLHVIPGDKR
jgi:hypothetical protein